MSTADTSQPPDEPRRLTPTERLHEALMAALSRRPAEPDSSVDLTRNAKGDVQIAVTVRSVDPLEAERVAKVIYDRLAAAYPRQAPANGGPE